MTLPITTFPIPVKKMSELPAAGQVFPADIVSIARGGTSFSTSALAVSVCGLTQISEEYFDVYVDSVGGSDSNNGTRGFPVQTLAKAKTLGGNGTRYGLAANSLFRETFDLSASTGTYVGKYGVGADPVIACDDIVPNANFTAVGGSTPNLYQATITIQSVDLAFVSIFDNGRRYVLCADDATSNSTAGSYSIGTTTFPGTPSSTTVVVKIHTFDGSNPITNGRTFETPIRNTAYVDGDATCVIRNVVFRRNLWNNGSAQLFGEAYACTFLDGTKHNHVSAPGSKFVHCKFKDEYFAGQASNLAAIYAADAAGQTTIFEQCDFILTKGIPTDSTMTAGPFIAHTNGDGPTTNQGLIVISNCYMENGNSAIVATSDVNAVQVLNTTIVGCAKGVSCAANTLIENCTIQTADQAVAPVNGYATRIRGCNLTTNLSFTNGGAGTVYIQNSGVTELEVTGCTLINLASPGQFLIQGIGKATKATVTNNVMQSLGFYVGGFVAGLIGNTATVNNNTLLGGAQSGTPYQDAGFTNYSLAQLQSLAGQESGISGVQTVVATTGTTVQSNGLPVLELDPAGTIAALTVNFPLNPSGGKTFYLNSSQIVTALTVTALVGTISGTTTSLAVNTPHQWTYVASKTTWVKNF